MEGGEDATGELPLLTDSAVVTDVSAMDRNRTGETLAELRRTLDAHGTAAWARDRPADDGACEDWLGARLDGADHLERERPLAGYLPDEDGDARVGEKLTALQGRYLQPYPSLLRITVETDDPVEFLAGQYLSLRYAGTTRVYSVASSPTRDDIEFCVQRVPGGDMTSELSVDLEVGDEVTLRGPYGEFVPRDPSSRDVVFLATGTGVAPLKSMVDHLFETGGDAVDGEPRDVWLFLGAPWADRLPYHEAFRSYAIERPNFHYVPTLSRERYLTDWNGETAYVQHTLLKYLQAGAVDGRDLPESFRRYLDEPPRTGVDARLDPSNAEVYACGLNAMVEGLVDAAERIGVPPEFVRYEGFG